MGIDYSASFCIGYEVEVSEGHEREDYDEEEILEEVLSEALEDTPYNFGRYNSGYDTESTFIVGIFEVDRNTDLEYHYQYLNKVLSDYPEIEITSDFGLVGGEYVY